MVIPIFALIISIVLGVWSTFSGWVSLSLQNARTCEKTFLFVGSAGVLGSVVFYLLFFFSFRGAKDDAVFLRDTFNSFAVTLLIFVFAGILVSLGATVAKSKFRPLILPVMALWSLLGLAIVFAGFVWIAFSDSLCSLYFSLFGISAVALLCFASYFELRRRRIFLSDPYNINVIKEKRNDKKEARQKRRDDARKLREKKKRLRNPKR